MRENVNRRSFLKLTGSSALVLTAGNATAAVSRDELRQAAKEDVAAQTGYDPANLTLVTDTKATYHTIGEQFYRAKIRGPEGEAYESMLDGNTDPVSVSEVRQAEKDAYQQEYGKLTRDLADRVNEASSGEYIEIGVWHTGPDRAAARQAVDYADREKTGGLRQDLTEEIQARITEKSQTVAGDIAGIGEVEVVEVGETEARVSAMATPEDVNQIQDHELVQKLTLAEHPEVQPLLEEASQTHGAWSERNDRYNAAEYPVGVFGLSGIPDKQDLNISDSTTRGTYSSTPKDSHANNCGLAAASTEDGEPGTAHDAIVYATQDPGTSLDQKYQWFRNNDVPAVNGSWGIPYSDRKFHDWDARFNQFVFNNFQSIVMAAGNDGMGGGVKVFTPARAMNVFSVGATNNQDTGTTDSDDEWASYSCYKDPLTRSAFFNWNVSNVKKPEVSAAATPTYFPDNGGNHHGTSYAAPHVAGLATLITKFSDEVGGLWMEWFPELIKSITMVGATNTGDSTYTQDKMGAGTIEVPQTEKVVKERWYDVVCLGQSEYSETRTFTAEEGENVRVALTWLVDETQSFIWDLIAAQADVDLDLEVISPSGNVVACSWNWDGGNEFLEFDAQESGDYQVRITNWRWDSSDSYRLAGLAWNRY